VRPQHWYQLLLEVTAAPLANPDPGDEASAQLHALLEGDDPESKVTQTLVAALQLHSDPLGDPRHDMCGVVAAELGRLVSDGRPGAAFLVARSNIFQKCSDRWLKFRGEP
jgi:hypothetical protein